MATLPHLQARDVNWCPNYKRDNGPVSNKRFMIASVGMPASFAQMYLQPLYGNGVFDNVYFLAEQH